MGSFTGEKAEEAGGDCCRNEPGAPYRSEDLVRLMMADVLRDEGFRVIEASDAAEAFSILKAMAVDVVITDLRMRTIADGLELAAYVRAHCRGVSLVGASAYAPPITEDLGFDAFFIKPYNPEDIASWIRHRHSSTRCADSGLPMNSLPDNE
jgi:CheY-like chemotaxis protein